jgi:hypothetical protein
MSGQKRVFATSFQGVKGLHGKIIQRMLLVPEIPDERRYPQIPIIERSTRRDFATEKS